MPRNRELMRVFHDIDLVEQLGSGMQRILQYYDNKAFSFSDNFMRVSFYFDKEQKLGDKLGDKKEELTYTRQRILELMEIDARISITQIAEKLGYSSTAIEKNIDYLKQNGYLIRHGSTKTGYWQVLSFQ